MRICVQRHVNVSKQTTFVGGVDIGLPKWCVCWCSFNRFVHERMKDISNVKGSLKHSQLKGKYMIIYHIKIISTSTFQRKNLLEQKAMIITA